MDRELRRGARQQVCDGEYGDKEGLHCRYVYIALQSRVSSRPEVADGNTLVFILLWQLPLLTRRRRRAVWSCRG
jgi:hypothetical protein